MADILGLTTTDAIRTVWGLSAKDLSDVKLATLNLSLALEVQLEEFAIDLSFGKRTRIYIGRCKNAFERRSEKDFR